jgi:hypothetical protein
MKNNNPSPIHENKTGHDVFIVNQGNFGYGNSSLSYYDPIAKTVINNVFYGTNGLPLGDVANSMVTRDSLGYIVINNSGKIYIINENTFQYVGKITGFTSPRNICFISDTKAYVTDMYSKSIQIVNPKTMKITDSINIDNHTTDFTQHTSEQVVLYNNLAFVNSWSYDDKILVINTNTDQVVDSIIVTKQPNSMALDRNDHLWVLSDGGYSGSPYGQVSAALTEIDAKTKQVLKTFTFSNIAASPTGLCMNPTGDTLYYLKPSAYGATISLPGVYAMPINDQSLPSMPVINQDGRSFYALGVDPGNGTVYVSDAKDYTQSGEVFVYSSTGQVQDSITAGIIPGGFCFK